MSVSSVFGAAGITNIQVGSKLYKVEQPKTANEIKGFGDTIKVGDVFYCETSQDNWKDVEGPVLLEAVSADPSDPWFRWVRPDGHTPFADYKGSHWRRKFTLAKPEVAEKVKAALAYKGLYVRLYVSFNNLKTPARPTLISASWIAWVGDLQKAFREYDGPFGKLKDKNIIRWVKNKMFTDFSMKSKVAIPDDFPVSLL